MERMNLYIGKNLQTRPPVRTWETETAMITDYDRASDSWKIVMGRHYIAWGTEIFIEKYFMDPREEES